MSERRPTPPTTSPRPPARNEGPPADKTPSTARPGSTSAAAAGTSRTADYNARPSGSERKASASGITRTSSWRERTRGSPGSPLGEGYNPPPPTGETVVIMVADTPAATQSASETVPSTFPQAEEDFVFDYGTPSAPSEAPVPSLPEGAHWDNLPPTPQQPERVASPVDTVIKDAENEVHPYPPRSHGRGKSHTSLQSDESSDDDSTDEEDDRTLRAAPRKKGKSGSKPSGAISGGVSEVTTPSGVSYAGSS